MELMQVAPSGGQICNQFKWWYNGPRQLSLKLELSLNGYKFEMVKKIIKVKDSIPWVRCASSNVSLFTVFHRLSLAHPLYPSQMGRVFPVSGFLGCTSFGISSYHQLIFRSVRTSWNTFVRPPVRLRQKSRSHLKPYKSSQDHARPLIRNITVKRTMSAIIR